MYPKDYKFTDEESWNISKEEGTPPSAYIHWNKVLKNKCLILLRGSSMPAKVLLFLYIQIVHIRHKGTKSKLFTSNIPQNLDSNNVKVQSLSQHSPSNDRQQKYQQT